MGLFGISKAMQCDICGMETGIPENKRHKAKKGIICDDCYLKAGFTARGGCSGMPISLIQEQINSADGLSIYDRQMRDYQANFDSEITRLKMKKEISLATKEASAASQIKCPKCGSTQISADKQGYGVVKGAVGAVVAGPLGLAAGNIGAKKVCITCLNCGNQWEAGKQ